MAVRYARDADDAILLDGDGVPLILQQDPPAGGPATVRVQSDAGLAVDAATGEIRRAA